MRLLVSIDGKTQGPFTLDEVAAMLRNRQLRLDTPASVEGSQIWTTVRQVLQQIAPQQQSGSNVPAPRENRGDLLTSLGWQASTGNAAFIIAGIIISAILSAPLWGYGLAVDKPVALFAGLLVALLLASGVIWYCLRIRVTRWDIDLHENGFLVRAGHRSAWHDYSDITHLKMKESLASNDGVTSKHEVIMTGPGWKEELTQSGSAGPIALVQAYGIILSRCADLASHRLQSGGQLAGDGWHLDARHLHLERDGRSIALDQIAMAAEFNGTVSIHLADEEAPAFHLPAESYNAHLLKALLNRHATAEPARNTDEYGRLMFSKYPTAVSHQGRLTLLGWVIYPLCWVFLAALTGCGTLALVLLIAAPGALDPSTPGGHLLLKAGMLLAFSITFVFWSWLFLTRFLKSALLVHERGIKMRGILGGINAMLFKDMTALTYSLTRQYYNGVYTGTTIRLRVENEASRQKISYSKNIRGSDADLQEVCDAASMSIARRIAAAVLAGTPYVWKGITLTSEGVTFTPGLLIKTPVSLPHDGNLQYTIEDGTCTFKAPDGRKLGAFPCSARNFWPVFHALGVLAGNAESTQASN